MKQQKDVFFLTYLKVCFKHLTDFLLFAEVFASLICKVTIENFYESNTHKNKGRLCIVFNYHTDKSRKSINKKILFPA